MREKKSIYSPDLDWNGTVLIPACVVMTVPGVLGPVTFESWAKASEGPCVDWASTLCPEKEMWVPAGNPVAFPLIVCDCVEGCEVRTKKKQKIDIKQYSN